MIKIYVKKYDRNLRHLCDFSGSFVGFIQKLIARDNLGNETSDESLVSLDRLAGKAHFHRERLTNSSGESLGTASAGNSSQFDLRLTKDSFIGSVPNLNEHK